MHAMTRRRASCIVRNALLAVLTTLPLPGCGSSSSTGPLPMGDGVGALSVTITPAGFAASVTVDGPDGYHQSVTTSQTLSGLVPGSYTVAAAPVDAPHPIVGTARYDATVTNGTVAVARGATASASVSYAPQSGSDGKMWVANVGGHSVLGYSADQLGASMGNPPAVVIGTADVQYGAAFDANGTLWLSQTAINQVVAYTASQLAAGGSPTPTVTLATNAGSLGPGEVASLSGPVGLAFDRDGNLWVANFYNNTVVAFTPAQLGQSGSPAPAITLRGTGSLDEPAGLAFDESGTLWVASGNNDRVVGYVDYQRIASGTPTPAVTIFADAGSLAFPFGLAFDRGGNLWVGNFNSSTVVKFAKAKLAAGGSLTPSLTLRPVGVSLNVPVGLAFDASDNLWVANQFAHTIVRFTPSQLVQSGAPIPEVIVSGVALASPAAIAFDPPTGRLRR